MRSSLPITALLCALTLGACDNEAEPTAKVEPTAKAKVEPTAKAEPPRPATSTIVNVKASEELELSAVLAKHAALAKAVELAPFVELWATWCGPCKKLEAAMGDPRIEKAFAGVYLIRLDSDQWDSKLDSVGLDNGAIPVFYEIDEAGKPTGRKIDGGAWGEDIPENMAPPLDGFFHAKDS